MVAGQRNYFSSNYFLIYSGLVGNKTSVLRNDDAEKKLVSGVEYMYVQYFRGKGGDFKCHYKNAREREILQHRRNRCGFCDRSAPPFGERMISSYPGKGLRNLRRYIKETLECYLRFSIYNIQWGTLFLPWTLAYNLPKKISKTQVDKITYQLSCLFSIKIRIFQCTWRRASEHW